MAFINPSGSFENEAHGGPVTIVAPTSGSTVAMTSDARSLFVNNASTLATLTVKLPPGSHGQKAEIAFNAAVTTLTVQTNTGGAVTGAPTAGAAGNATIFRYISSAIGWIKWK